MVITIVDEFEMEFRSHQQLSECKSHTDMLHKTHVGMIARKLPVHYFQSPAPDQDDDACAQTTISRALGESDQARDLRHSGCGEKPLGSEAAPQGEPCRAVSSTVPGRHHRRSGELLVKVADLEGTA
jgi:hypothetical protein